MSPTRARPVAGAERALGWWQAVVDRSTDLLLAFDHEGRITYVSPSVTPMLGYAPEDLVGTDGLHVVIDEDRPRVAAALAAIVGPDGASQQVFRVRRQDGTIRHLEARGTSHLDDPEVGAVLISMRDVTDRLTAERSLAERDALYRTIVEATSDAVVIHAEGTIFYANPAAAQLLGVDDPLRVAGRQMEELFRPEAGSPADEWAPGNHHRVVRLDGRSLDAELTAIPTVWGGQTAVQVVIRDITERQLHDLALLHQATHDPLTGLPNRSLLADRLEHAASRAARTRRPFAVLFVDLDRFKVVNDTLGHEVGDELLRQIAVRLGDAVRPGDTVARLGGDEFVVVVEDLLVTDTVDLVVERIQEGFAAPFAIEDRDFLINASIGVLVTTDGRDPKSLLRDADAAMYTAKTQGRGRAVRFDGALRERASRHEEMRLRLRAALDEDQLWIALQPVVRLADRRVVAVEALMRWEHPDLGTMLPEGFLDVADDAGLLPELGALVLDAACGRLARWRRDAGAGSAAAGAWVGVNVAQTELLHPGFDATVRGVLERHDLPGSALCLEVTERALLDDPTRVGEVLRPLRDLGVQLSIDDFGTGYTSLAVLRRFSPDHVKIDRAFVGGMADSPSDAATVRALIQMGHALGVSVVAEGVELVEQQHLLAVLGCDLAQGFLLGRPARDLDLPPA
ncbi:putative bifunctional diguanylate cyclase/phosphodiesterase [Actinomarinicola tropica]|uniref:putative bifunctional diguanylate cyclase/phosphodiesterase n=1 Tax=Actinomarinicola tropica TaxID=2789776 RepID=UPI001899DFA0|nr:EAL domain-containing protein [Actinomarinicola tropica]